MSGKSLVSFFIILVFAVFLTPACASKKYVRTRVDERVSPLEGRTAELEDGSRKLKNQTDILENRTSSLDEATKRLQGDLSSLDQKSTQGIEEAKNEANQARKDSLAETAKVDNRVNNRINSLDNWQEQQAVTVFFKLNQSQLTNEGKAELDKLIGDVLAEKGYLIEIKGFTDSTGTPDANRKLSQQRANSVFQYLVEKDVPAYKINLVGLGELKPVSNNSTKTGRQENRRVEVRLLINQGIKSADLSVSP